jgi:hypothetical protein
MTVSLRRNAAEQPQAPAGKASKPDIYDIVVRMVIGLLVNYITRRLHAHQDISHDRKVASRKMEKLAKKGKDAPADLKEQAVAGMSKRQQKKFAAELAKKGAGGKKKVKKKGKMAKKKSGGKLRWIIAIAIVVAVAVKVAAKK